MSAVSSHRRRRAVEPLDALLQKATASGTDGHRLAQVSLSEQILPPASDLDDIQGDIFPSFSKKAENIVLFEIVEPALFRKNLQTIIPRITTSNDVLREIPNIYKAREERSLHKITHINIGFNSRGLKALSEESDLGDPRFAEGMGPHAVKDLGDKPVSPGSNEPLWESSYEDPGLNGIMLLAGECEDSVDELFKLIFDTFGDSMNVIAVEQGRDRPGDQSRHEHFGWRDGVSQPALRGLSKFQPQLACDPGVIIFGHPGDSGLTTRPDWTKNGSIMAFRKLHQNVPEFHKFIKDHPADPKTLPIDMDLPREQRSEITGARLVGRWPSGAPVDLTPFSDDTDLSLSNDFDYMILDPKDVNGVRGQHRCPFAAHIRKMAPRKGTSLGLTRDVDEATLQKKLERSMIIRTGIPYGPELTDEEKEQEKTIEDRGLAFISYQSDLSAGFAFLQQAWANNASFPPQHTRVSGSSNVKSVLPGFDPLIGATNNPDNSRDRHISGIIIKDLDKQLDMKEDFVVPKGGEYFFMPSITTLKKYAARETN